MSGPPADGGALARLYRVPPSRFVAERKALVAELRAAGDEAAAAEIAAARKPTPTAWAVDQIAIRHPDALRALSDAVEVLRAAQGHGGEKGAAGAVTFAAARAALRDHTREVTQLARAAMEEEKLPWSAAAQRRISQTLNAIPFADATDRALLFAGRLDKDLDAVADFGALAGGSGADAEPRPDAGRPALGLERRPDDGGTERAKPDERDERKESAKRTAEERRAAEASRAAAAEARREAKERARLEEARRAEDLERRKRLLAAARVAERTAKALEAEAVRAARVAERARADADAAKIAAAEAREAAGEDPVRRS